MFLLGLALPLGRLGCGLGPQNFGGPEIGSNFFIYLLGFLEIYFKKILLS